MLRTVKLPVHDLNPHLTCALCGGYYIDATTIIECLHSFCKSCIVRYLESSKFCPICDVQVHKNRPMENIRPDETLQDLVYKLVPGLFTREMKKRREFYSANPAIPSTSGVSTDSGSDVKSDKSNNNNTDEDKISISIEFSPDGLPLHYGKRKRHRDQAASEPHLQKRYLLCPAAFTIGLLKKFIRMKLDLESKYEIDVFHRQETLSDNYTLMDIAYIYTWRKSGPFRLFYAVYEPGTAPVPKRIKQEANIMEEVTIKQEPGLGKVTQKSGKAGAPKPKGGGRKRGRPKAANEEAPLKRAPSKAKKGKSSVRQTVSYLLKCSGKKYDPPSSALISAVQSSGQNMGAVSLNASQPRIDANVTALPVSLPLPSTVTTNPAASASQPSTSKQGMSQEGPQPLAVKKPAAAGKAGSKVDTPKKPNALPKGWTPVPSGTVVKVPTVKAPPKTGQASSKPKAVKGTGAPKPAKVASAGKKSSSQQGTPGPHVKPPSADVITETNKSTVIPAGVQTANPTQPKPTVTPKPDSKKQRKSTPKKPRETVPKIKISTLMQGKTGCLKATISTKLPVDASLSKTEESPSQTQGVEKPKGDNKTKPLTDEVARDKKEQPKGKDAQVKNAVPTTQDKTAKDVPTKERQKGKQAGKTPCYSKVVATKKKKVPTATLR